MTAPAPNPAFANQAAFRAVMECFARPGAIKAIVGIAAPAPLAPTSAALIQALADYETPVWLDHALAAVPAVGEWVRFQTGAPLAQEPNLAAFAVIADPQDMPDFSLFAQGTEEYPDRSTTVIVQIERFSGHEIIIEGPGIKGTRKLAAENLPDNFTERLRENRERFPLGVDLVIAAGSEIAALPRSVRVVRES
jgi:alpha-D-ribose 1-methylphosphonate 5-triphosphate synthase subunit PhnH